MQPQTPPPPGRLAAAFAGALLVGALAWAYLPSFVQMARRWSEDPQYTHGYVVPVFAAVVLWSRRDRFPARLPGTAWGLPFVAAAGACRLAGAMYAYEWLEAGSLVPALLGAILLAGGTALLRWAWPVFAFLLFVLPWPWQVDQLLTYPLRRVATVVSTYALQTMGIPALARGNVILINELTIGVVDACSGLGMLMTFFALSTAVAFVIDRHPVEKVIVFLSAVPIGVLMNILRITGTVVLWYAADADTAKVLLHDVAGWVMMPAALVCLWLELLWLKGLWKNISGEGPVRVALAGPAVLPAPQREPPAPPPSLRGRRHRADHPDHPRTEAPCPTPLLERTDVAS